MTALSDSQAEALVAIVEYMYAQPTPTPLPPSIRELATATGVPSTSTVLKIVRSLQDDGYLVDNDGFTGISRANTRLTSKGDIVGSGMILEGELLLE